MAPFAPPKGDPSALAVFGERLEPAARRLSKKLRRFIMLAQLFCQAATEQKPRLAPLLLLHLFSTHTPSHATHYRTLRSHTLWKVNHASCEAR